MKIPYIKDKKVGSIEVSDSIFGAGWNPDLVKQVILAQQSNRRANTAQTKDRSEVRGADQKPWRQKGTGRARHGSIYSPIWRGGGVTFGPLNERNYDKKVNRKMRAAALRSALSKRVQDEALSGVEIISLESPKTATVKTWIEETLTALKKESLLKKTGHAVVLVADNPTESLRKSLRNLGNVRLVSAADLNAEDVMLPQQILFVGEAAINKIVDRLEKQPATAK